MLDKDQMVAFLTEAYKLEAYFAVETRYNYDSVSADMLAAYDKILADGGITKEQVETSITYYAQHPERYEAIQREVLVTLDSLVAGNI